MNREIKFEEKYKNLKAKFMESVDLAFRLGFEQGQQQAAQDQMAQQQQTEQMQAQGQAGAGDAPPAADQASPQEESPMGSELDQHLNELESLLGKSEISMDDLKKTIGAIKIARDLKKSHEAIKGIGLALHSPSFKMSQNAQHNLSNNSKQSLQIQHKIVSDIFKAWDEEEAHATKAIGHTLEVEGLVKK